MDLDKILEGIDTEAAEQRAKDAAATKDKEEREALEGADEADCDGCKI